MKRILLLVVGMFALGLDAFVISGLLPFISHDLNVSVASAAQAVTAFTLCYALSAPIFATLLSGKEIKNILLLALLIFTCGNMLSALSANFSLLIFSRCIAGVGAGIYSPLAVASSAALVKSEQKGSALSLALGGMSMGVVLGVPLGLLIATKVSWQWTLWLISALGIIGMVAIKLKFPKITAPTPPTIIERLSILRNLRVAVIVAISFLTAVASLGLYTFISLIVTNLNAKYSLTEYFWVWGIGGMVGSFTVGNIIDKTRAPRIVMVFILTLLALSLLAIPFTIELPIISFVPFLLWGMMGWASQTPQQHALISVEPCHTSAAVALNSSINYLGGAVGTVSGGILLSNKISATTLTYLACLVAIIAVIGQVFIIYYNRNK
ncbi:MAG: MFS transporter [Proteobacteria bacterium]|nr:MAG: MFS transporter [Pseudomonadota bacterium]